MSEIPRVLPQGPLYPPDLRINKFMYDQDYNNLRYRFIGRAELFEDHYFSKDFFMGESGVEDKEWKRPWEICNSPYFIKDKPHRFDALQGELGDCWFVAAVEALTLNQYLIEHVVPPDQSFYNNYIGAFHFRFWELGTWYDIVVDDRLPVFIKTQTLCYVHSRSGDVFWACLLEKAYAKLYGGFDEYINLKSGIPTTALQDLSGGIVEKMNRLTESDPTDPFGFMVWMVALGRNPNVGSDEMIIDAMMCCSCVDDLDNYIIPGKLYTNHSYCITKLYRCPVNHPEYPGLLLVRIMNPWGGGDEWRGPWSDRSEIEWPQLEKWDKNVRARLNLVFENDGEFWMEESDFIEWFYDLYICFLGPGQYIEARDSRNVNTWSTHEFKGSWVRYSTAGGSRLEHRYKNPQIILSLEQCTNRHDDKCYVVIELTQKSMTPNERTKRNIRFYVYSLINVGSRSGLLDNSFFQNNEALNEKSVDFFDGHSYDRSYVAHMRLYPGQYCVIPCTEREHEEQRFLLRMFSESRFESWNSDEKISKSSPKEGEHLRTDLTNERLSELFHDFADGAGEIDWIHLKEILGEAMNSNNYFSLSISKFLIFFWDVFEMLFFTSPSQDSSETGYIEFSKDDCRSMIALLDDDRSGKLNFSEFIQLWGKLSFWTEVYKHHIEETEECMSVSQLRDALSSIGYNINRQVLHVIIHKYANEKDQISLRDFIICGVSLESGMSLFQKKCVEGEDKIVLSLEEWVKNTLHL